ncbi:glycoside hydrolase family 76 protein [Mucilaginibacter sp. KACC 22063]|uniref:glycoside hydrolase family 76 protein n=1 Tax=Mucilaginibacter sp. KACC 22063 TaxID=3025666 RepID=UPI002365591F|nr:glycoside hydrolase family 76 protein [Mucilaginibacter sp. KACC 22063]WDF53899.1 glycoside hydrolase family 76 protein [Mucilaginibacter sp. KACC 22063]
MKLKKLLFLLLSFLLLSNAKAQSDYINRAQLINKSVNHYLRDSSKSLYYETTEAKNENPHSWLWPLTAMVQGANEMEALDKGARYMQPVEKAIDQYYSDEPPVPAYQDYVLSERKSSRFYDDNEWLAITFIDAYNRTHRKTYLDKAQLIYKFILSGTDTVTGGGVYWKEGDLNTKNTCSNGPAVIIALQLYKLTHKKAYLDYAMSVYNWTNRWLQAPEGIYWDNINTKTHKIGKAFYTYNIGTMLQSNVLLYQVTKKQQYLTEARRIAKAGIAHFFKNGRLPNNEYWFNAVMLRGYQALYEVDRNPEWIDFYKKDAEQIWLTERDKHNLVSGRPVKRLIDQGAMMEIYARLAQIDALKK